MATVIPRSLIQAYRETHYGVDGPSPFAIQVDVASDPLRTLYGQFRTDCCAYLTACNPLGERVGDSVNRERQSRLAGELARRALDYRGGTGRHPDGDWPGEPSYLVLGLSREDATALARAYDQNALIWCGPDAVPQLILLR